MSVEQLIAEFDNLTRDEQQLFLARIGVAPEGDLVDESAELLAAIDDGARSLREEPTLTLEELRERAKSWAIKSS